MNSLEKQRQLQDTKDVNNKARAESDANFIKVPTRSSQALSKEVMISGGTSSTLSSALYPSVGIPLSTGTSWGSSITNNSSNWNSAYGWGDHSAIGYWKSSFHPTTIAGYGITDILSFSGTAVDNQVAVWTSSNLLEGTTGLVYDGVTLSVTGNITATGEVSAFAGAAPIDWWDSMPLATTTTIGGVQLDGTTTNYLRGDGTWQTVASGGGMVYPSAGIGVSTGSGWTTSVVNNSTHWNSAYGWGNHASAGYAPLANPSFTGTVSIGNSSITNSGNFELRDAGITDSTAVRFFSSSGSLYLQNGSGDNIIFRSKTTSELMRLTNSGYLGIGIASPISPLDVSGIIRGTSFQTNSATPFTIEQSGTKLNIKYGSTVVLSISSAGLMIAKDEVTAFGTP